jgi:hypothetical protein
MGELAAKRPAIFELVGPRDDEADAPAAAAGIGLVGREGGVGDLGPTHRVNGGAAPGADPVFALQIDVDRQWRQPGIAPVEVQGAGGSRGVGTAIVGREDKDGIGQLPDLVEQCHEAADILVGAVEHRGIGFHVARKEMPLLGGNIVPGGYGRIALGQPGPRRDQSHRQLALKARGANCIPAGIVLAAIFRQICFLGLQWPMHGIIGDIEEERPGRVLVADLADKADRLVHPIVGRVIALGIGVDRSDDVVVDDPRRKKVPGLAFEKSIETVESAIGGPGRVRRDTVRRIVPLADGDRCVSGGAQSLGYGRRVERNIAEIAGKARVVVGQPPGCHRMRISSGQ